MIAHLVAGLLAESNGGGTMALLALGPAGGAGLYWALYRYYRNNDKRMRYRTFRSLGLPVGSGIVESAHRHVLQVRMKRAGQRWSIVRARRMTRLRAIYRTAGAHRFHWAIREALKAPPPPFHQQLPNAPRLVKHRYTLHMGSPLNRARAAASK